MEEITQKQSIIRYDLGQTRTTLKKMVTCLICNIEELSGETGKYHDQLENYSEKISQTDELEILNQLLNELMNATKQNAVQRTKLPDRF